MIFLERWRIPIELRPTTPTSSTAEPASGSCSFYLHGKGERGTNPRPYERTGRHNFTSPWPDRFSSFAAMSGREKMDAAKLDEFLTAFCESNPVDPERSTHRAEPRRRRGWNLLRLRPERFAASILICGRIDPTTRLTVQLNPIWLIQYRRRRSSRAHSDTLFEELKAIGAPVTYTRYDSFGHVKTWQDAYRGRASTTGPAVPRAELSPDAERQIVGVARARCRLTAIGVVLGCAALNLGVAIDRIRSSARSTWTRD